MGVAHMYQRVDVRHINYNDFLPLMAERDLNYRYPAWRAGAGCPDSPFLITGCTRAFQESDSRHNSRVMGQSLPPSPLCSSFQPFSLYPSISLPPAFSSSMYQLSSKIYRRIDPPMIRFPWSFQMLPPLCGMQYTCSRGIGNYKIFFLFELDEDLMVPWEHHHDRIKRSICDTNLDGSFRNDEKYRN